MIVYMTCPLPSEKGNMTDSNLTGTGDEAKCISKNDVFAAVIEKMTLSSVRLRADTWRLVRTATRSENDVFVAVITKMTLSSVQP